MIIKMAESCLVSGCCRLRQGSVCKAPRPTSVNKYREGGGLQKKFLRGYSSRLKNFDHLCTSRSLILWPISIQNCHKNHLIRNELGAFLAKFSKIHPILQIGRVGSGIETYDEFKIFAKLERHKWLIGWTPFVIWLKDKIELIGMNWIAQNGFGF